MKISRILHQLLSRIAPRSRPAARMRKRQACTPLVAAEMLEEAAEVLEDRVMLSADVSGWWIINGQAAQILQSDGAVTVINEHGNSSTASFSSPNQLVAADWGNLAGTCTGSHILWANGTVWFRIPEMSSTGTMNGNQPILVQQLGIDVRVTNENGASSDGHFINATQFVARDWGNLTATLVGNQILWANGSVWTSANAASGVSVNVSGTWANAGEETTILQFGSDLVFVNENGEAAKGTLVSSTRVVAAEWNNLGGTIDSASQRIVWDNGSIGDRVPVFDRNENWHLNGTDLPTAISQMGVTLVFTNENGQRTTGLVVPQVGVTATDWSLDAKIDFANAEVEWANGSQWDKSQFGANDILFSDFNNWPWLYVS
jgi:hypothetical protein